MQPQIKPISFLALIFCAIVLGASCNPEKSSNKAKEASANNNEAFKIVDGIRFFEVKRRFKNGLSFNKDGFYHQPNWIIEFKAPDTMLAYSPEKKGMEAFYLQYDHGKVYNFAREFFRAKTITKDSLVLQRLQVDGKVIAGDDDIRSDVFSTYYTKDYIENKLRTTVGELQRPTKADTLFIKDLSIKALADPSNASLAFAATEPVVFVPKSKYVSVEKISTIDETNKRNASVDYMYPQYKLTIERSYKEFGYSFSVVVDAHGKLYVNNVEGVMPDDVAPRKRLLQSIADVYLKNLFKIVPGKTLGIPHGSEVSIFLVGHLAK